MVLSNIVFAQSGLQPVLRSLWVQSFRKRPTLLILLDALVACNAWCLMLDG